MKNNWDTQALLILKEYYPAKGSMCYREFKKQGYNFTRIAIRKKAADLQIKKEKNETI